jgi:CDP-glucose 4,6-dehydratase
MEGMEIKTYNSVTPDFWKEKRVLVTGHTGFKGSWLSLWLQNMNARVLGLALPPPTTPSLFLEAKVENEMESIIGDIRNYELVQDVFINYKPEIIFHLAAQPLVRYSYQNPIETYSTNVMGTVNVLEASRQTKSVKAVINVTTDKCYENREWIWGYREEEAMGGFDPYSSSKGSSELITSAYLRSYFQANGVGLASARAGNVIGGGDWAEDRLIPDILKAISLNKFLDIRNPQSIRPWQHVLEPLSGYLILAQELYQDPTAFSGAWNFGPNEDDVRPVNWIVDKMLNDLGGDLGWNFKEKSDFHEATYLKLDISKAKKLLKWYPLLGIDLTLELISDWHTSWLKKEDIKSICLKQIKFFSTKSESRIN